MDLNLFKNFKVGERFNFAIGAQAFNVFNHPNFGLPNASYASTFTGAAPIPDPTFGIISTHAGNRRPVPMATSLALTHLRALCSSARRSCSSRNGNYKGRPKGRPLILGCIFVVLTGN